MKVHGEVLEEGCDFQRQKWLLISSQLLVLVGTSTLTSTITYYVEFIKWFSHNCVSLDMNLGAVS